MKYIYRTLLAFLVFLLFTTGCSKPQMPEEKQKDIPFTPSDPVKSPNAGSSATTNEQQSPSSSLPEIVIPQKENYGGFLDDPSAPYLELSFEGIAYPDSISVKAVMGGKIYFAYRNDPPGETDQRQRLRKNLHQAFSYGVYDLASQTVEVLPGSNFLNADNQIVCTSQETLMMPNGILYQQGCSAADGCVTYITDFTGDGTTSILARQPGEFVRPIANMRAVDPQRFVMYFRDYGGYTDRLYLYDLTDNSVKLISEHTYTQEEWTSACDVYGDTIWRYYLMKDTDGERYHLLRSYTLDGTLKKEYRVPDSVSSYSSFFVQTFAPAKMHCLAENVFYVPDQWNIMGFLLVIEDGQITATRLPRRERIRNYVANTVENPEVVYLLDEENCALMQLNVKTLEYRALHLNPWDPEETSWLNIFSDAQGNVVVQDLLQYFDSPDGESKTRYFYIPRSTIDQYSVTVK